MLWGSVLWERRPAATMESIDSALAFVCFVPAAVRVFRRR